MSIIEGIKLRLSPPTTKPESETLPSLSYLALNQLISIINRLCPFAVISLSTLKLVIAFESVTAHTFYFRFLLSMIRPSGATSHPCCHWSTIYDSLYASLVDINEEKIIREKISSLFCFMRNCFHIVFWQQISQGVPFGK